MPKDSRVTAPSSRQFHTQPYRTHVHTNVPSTNSNTSTATPAMEAMTSPPPPNMANSGASFMASPIQERASAAWTEEDDQRLMDYRAKGQNWVVISEKFPGKTGNACRKRHERLIEKRNANHLDGVRLKELALAYTECRESMWKMVAERIGGEKWQVIEQKCMEKGLKTLTNTARASRRAQSQHGYPVGHAMDSSPERMMDPSQEQFDSGIYGMGMPSVHRGSSTYGYHPFAPNATQDMSAFYAQQPNPAVAVQPTEHSRRQSTTHSVGHHSVDHSSRSTSNGPMQPPQATNPFASPQVQQQYFGAAGQGGLAMAPTLSSQHFTPTTLAAGMHAQEHGGSSNGLPSISSAFDAPRLPSIMSSQG